MATNRSEYQESTQYNPILAAMRIKLFALQRYLLNILLFAAAGALCFFSRQLDGIAAVAAAAGAVPCTMLSGARDR